MKQDLEIRPCSSEDANEISDIAIKTYREFYLYLWEDDGSWYINRSFRPKQLVEEIENPNSKFFSLETEGETIGYMKLNLRQPLEGFEQLNAMELERIYLMKAFSGKGFGREAVEFCFDLAEEMKKEVIWLKSMDSSPAIDFYLRLGFEVCGSYQLDYELMKPEFRGMKILMKKLE